jgi:lysozyme
MTPELLAHLKKQEGFVGHPYLCPAGKWTIGYGHRVPDQNHANMTEADAEALLIEDVVRYEAMALRLSPGLTTEPRRLAAITDFCYNAGGAAYAGSILRLRVNEKKWKDAAAQMQKWIYATNPVTKKKFVFSGLVKRRAVTAQWLLEGEKSSA